MLNNKIIKHYYWIDWFRFFAAVVVFVCHARTSVFPNYGDLLLSDQTIFVKLVYASTRVANEAVVTFFVLSGFLVGGKAIEKLKEDRFNPRDYAIDRISRIALPLLPAIFLTAIIRLVVDGHFSVIELIGNLLSLQGIYVEPFGGNGPLWTLAYEVWFYALVYAIGLAVFKGRFCFVSLCILFIIASVFSVLETNYLFCWLIGAVGYLYKPSKFSKNTVAMFLIFSVYSVVSMQIGQPSSSISLEKYYQYFPSLEVSRLALSLSIVALVQQFSLLKPRKSVWIRAEKLGTILAASSYTLYLVHTPLLQLLYDYEFRAVNFSQDSAFIFFVTLVICYLLSLVLYFMFERNTLRLRNYLKSKFV